MPIFEYTCPACGENFERLVRSHDTPPPSCPKCGSAKVEKQFSVFGASVKPSVGSGAGAECSTCPHGGGCPNRRD